MIVDPIMCVAVNSDVSAPAPLVCQCLHSLTAHNFPQSHRS